MFSDSVVLSFVLFTPCAAAFNFSFLNTIKIANNHSPRCLIHKLVEKSIFFSKTVCLPPDENDASCSPWGKKVTALQYNRTCQRLLPNNSISR